MQGPQDDSEAKFWPHFGILNNFPHFLWMNNSIEYCGLYWMNIFLNEYFGFCFEWIFFWMNILDFVLTWILNWIIFRPDSMKKWIFKSYRQWLSDDHDNHDDSDDHVYHDDRDHDDHDIHCDHHNHPWPWWTWWQWWPAGVAFGFKVNCRVPAFMAIING